MNWKNFQCFCLSASTAAWSTLVSNNNYSSFQLLYTWTYGIGGVIKKMKERWWYSSDASQSLEDINGLFVMSAFVEMKVKALDFIFIR